MRVGDQVAERVAVRLRVAIGASGRGDLFFELDAQVAVRIGLSAVQIEIVDDDLTGTKHTTRNCQRTDVGIANTFSKLVLRFPVIIINPCKWLAIYESSTAPYTLPSIDMLPRPSLS
ncbi:hypothetical protein [Ralstonia solanacearum]|uniref:hypothetical protein n=1 Tax=Ralstonia solanacearum TaxID=305 RepID=UPI0013C3116C|nr:hypothetical protein [Ralstonia solanacearum]